MLAKRIHDLLDARAPYALCDDCIAGELGAPPAKVRAATEAFGLTNDFTRVTANCPGCGAQSWTTKSGGTE